MGSGMWRTPTDDNWFAKFTRLDAAEVWQLLREPVRRHTLPDDFFAVPTLEDAAFYRPWHMVLKRSAEAPLSQRVLDRALGVVAPVYAPLGPLQRLVAHSTSTFERKQWQRFTVLQRDFYRTVLCDSVNWVRKEIELTVRNIRLTHVPLVAPHELCVDLFDLGRLAGTAPRPPRALCVVHDTAWADRLLVRMRIDDDEALREWRNVPIGFKLSEYGHLADAHGWLGLPDAQLKPTGAKDLFDRPAATAWQPLETAELNRKHD